MSHVSSPLCHVYSWQLWAKPMHVSLPSRESYHTITYQIIAGAFICFDHLTDQTFIWDQEAIWAWPLKCHKLRQPLCEFSGILLQLKLLWRRKRFSQPALAANSSSLLSGWRTFVSPSPWSFCRTLSHGVPPFADHQSPRLSLAPC